MKLDLINYKTLKDLPSGSGIEYYDGKIYLVGDDATGILVTNKRWKKQYNLVLSEGDESGISKNKKKDPEATALLQIGRKNYLLAMGSGSTADRNKGVILDMRKNAFTEFDCSIFYERVKRAGITRLNIEGAAQVHDHLLLSNRAGKENSVNQFIVTSPDFFQNQEEAPVSLLDIDLSAYEEKISVSGITYSDTHDQVIFTTSLEDAGNSHDDSPGGKSYLGIIENGYRKIWKHNMKVNELIDLPGTCKEFKGHKVESVCIQSERDHSLKMHMVADDDKGKTVLFKVRLRF